MRLLKRTLSAFLAFVMVFTMLPLQVWASETQQDTSDQPVNFGSMVEPAAGGDTEYDYTIRMGEAKIVSGSVMSITWKSSDSSVVKISNNGLLRAEITGITPGDATITHGDKFTKKETFRVKVLPLVDSLTLDKKTMTLTGKQTEKLTATLNPENEKVTVDWKSSNPSVATVDDEGNVTSVGVGTATITATVSGTSASDSCAVTVQEVPELAIKLEPLTLALSQTGTMALEYNPEPLGTPTLTWSVPEDSEIADIDPLTGVITPKKVGSVQVTATAQLGEVTATGTQDLTVTDKIQPTGIRLDKENMKLQRGAAEKLTATLEPDGAESKIVWSSSNERVATVDENGLVTSRGLGDTIITASVEGHPEIKDECRVNVEYDYATTGETKIYVYLEIKNETGKELEGWTINESNFYTVGQYSVPFDILKPADYRLGHGEPLDKDSYVTRDISDITGYLPWTEFHPSNAAVVGSVDLSQIPWKLRYVTNGANHYQDKGACWHLDGLYTLKNEMAKVTVHYKDRFGNTIADSVTDNNIEIGDQYTIRIKDIPGYTPVSINGEPIKNGSTEIKQPVVGKDVTFTVIYNGNPTNYILEYKDIATREKIKDSETVESEKGKTILAKDIERKKIPNFEFVKITPDSIQVGKDGANTFTLWYKRNTHTVTYKYIDPITGKEGIVGSETQGAGLEVAAKADPNIPGYTFNGWEDTAETGKVKIENGKFIMPDRDVTFTGSFSVPDSQKYAVKATIKLADRVLASETKTDISWGELGRYYGMNARELANAFWNLGLTDSENMNATWEPLKADAAMQYEAAQDSQYHKVTIILPETSPALFTLTYDANGEDVTNMPDPKSAKYLKGTEVTVASAPTRENYTFSGWNTAANGSGTSYSANETITLTDNTTLFAQWTANTADYKVQYWFQKADGSGYEQREDAPGYQRTGTIGQTITPDKLSDDKIPAGFAFERMDENVTIAADGNAVANVYYDRKSYNVTYVIDGAPEGVKAPIASTGRYGATITIEEDLSAEGYTFTGWHTAEDSLVAVVDNDVTFTMPAGNVTLYGTFSKRTDLSYTVKYLWNGTDEEVRPSVTYSDGTLDETVQVKVPEVDKYTPVKRDDITLTITADETQNVVNVYYYKNVTLTANSDNKRVYNGEPQSLSGYTASVKDLTFENVVEPTATATNAGEHPLIFADGTKGKTDSMDQYIVTDVKDGALTINPKAVTLRTESASKDYDGTALTKDGVDGRDGFVTGDVTTVRATGTQTLVGESKNTIEIVWTDNALAKNYTITENLGTLTVTAPENLDEYVVKTHEGQNFKVGDTVTFKITVTNIYAVKATVKLEEMVGMTFGNGQTALEDVLDPGQTKTYTATRILTEQDFENGGVRNTVKVTLDPEKDGEPEIPGTDTDEVPLESKPDMSVEKTVLEPKESYRVGDTIRYKITVTNTGNVPLHDLELTDVMNADGKVTFPAGTDLTRETLNVGDSWIVTCSYVVRAADEGKTISNTAKVISRDDDGNPNKDGEDTTPGESVQKRYSLTIHYRNAAGNAVAGSYSARYHVGDSFKIDSPIVAGYYDPQIRSISSGANGMPAQDLEYVVIYTAIPAPVDPDPEGPNPGPNVPDDDDDDDDTPPVPDPEQEQPPQPQDFEIDPDDYTLTEVEDNETPLANLNLEGHTCCILHLLLMLAAMVVLGFDTKSRKKHQARIFELKKMLATEEDHSDDPEQP